MLILTHSEKAATIATPTSDPINVFCQYFLHPSEERQSEIKLCLRKNVENPYVSKIYLINERIYTDDELGITSEKIVQHNLGSRLKFSDVFRYIASNAITGYNVIINSDIFVDKTIDNLHSSELHMSKKMFALLRYEYDSTNIAKSKIFGPRADSQDTWIIHSNYTPTIQECKVFSFEFGKPGCDNKIIYLMNILGYEVLNDPIFIKTYHVHESQLRNYTIKDRVPVPYSVIVPYGYPLEKFDAKLGINLVALAPRMKNFTEIRFDDNVLLHNYVKECLDTGKRFIVPRIAGIENNFAIFGEICKKAGGVQPQIGEYFKNVIGAMKNNAGILMTSMESIYTYSDKYVKALDNADIIGGWEVYGKYYQHIQSSYDYVCNKYKRKQFFWTFAMDIFHYIHSLPWTHALRGRRILIVSAFEDSIREVLPNHAKIYGVDLFPECTFTTIKPPQTQAAEPSREFDIELADFCKRLDDIKDTYDVALVSCGGYGNLVCNHMYESGKSAVYVGGVLQMYFGVLGNRWLRERPDILRLYMNEYWTRPKESEKPKNFQAVEGSCYW